MTVKNRRQPQPDLIDHKMRVGTSCGKGPAMLRRLAILMSLLAALIVGATMVARADMMTPCPMMDHSGGTGDADYPMPCAGLCVSLPFAAPNEASSTVHDSLDRAAHLAPIYSFAVTGRDPPPPFHPPRV
jgi:hypothetical protein